MTKINPFKLKIKKLYDDVKLPYYATEGASGMDLHAYMKEEVIIKPGDSEVFSTGIAVAIPESAYPDIGLEIQVRPRSGLGFKYGITLINSIGTIDADYRGEIKVKLINFGKEEIAIKPGMRIAQMILCPIVRADLEVIDELPSTNRGEGGFGSTGE